MSPVIHTPPNEQDRIDQVWLFVSIDETGEGVCAFVSDGVSWPLIAADERRLEMLMPIAHDVSAATGKRVKLIKLSQRTEVMTIQPDGNPMQ